MDNGGQITEEAKNELYKKIIDIMLVSLENGSLSADDSESVSYFVVDNLDKADSQSYVEAFLEELAKRWPAFSSLLVPIHEQQSAQLDKQNIASVTNELKNLNQ